MKILLTGFEPFGGSAVNPSEQVVRHFAAHPPADLELVTAILPVERSRGPSELLQALGQHQPQAVICLGEAARRPAISIERVAINLLDYRIPDNSGQQVTDEQVVPGGPAAYFVTLPVREMQKAIQDAGIPVELSLSAGTYLCNQVLYILLHELASKSMNIPAGFIHLPQLPEQASRQNPPAASMSLEAMVTGIRAALATVL